MVGKKIHAARKTQGITLSQLAEQAGISKGHLSQIEHGQTDPSLSVLRKISEILCIPTEELFETESPREVAYIPRQERIYITRGGSHVRFELISAHWQLYSRMTSFDLFACNLLPDTSVPADALARNCEMLIYIVEGDLCYQFSGGAEYLSTGDSIHVSNNTGHSLHSCGRNVAELLIILTPKQEDEADGPVSNPAMVSQRELSWNVTGEKIRSLRREQHLRISDFADMIGVSPTHVSRMERNMLEPSLSVLRRAATVLGVTIPELLSGSASSDIVITTPQSRKKYAFTSEGCQVTHSFCTPNHGAGGLPGMSVYLAELGTKSLDNQQYALHEDSDELIILLSGNMKLITDDIQQLLCCGDAVFIPRGISHQLYNPGETPALCLGIQE